MGRDGYIHGDSDTEQARLTLMQSLLNEEQLRHLDLTGVRRILDVGAGLGDLTRALVAAAPRGCTAVAIERSERQLGEARRRSAGDERIEFRQGSAEDLPLAADEVGSFDLVHARFLLEHLERPEAAVAEMVRAARPGGRIVLVDDDHELLRLWPACPDVERVWRIYWESYRDRGQDPLVGRRLTTLLVEAGARPERSSAVFYGAVSGNPHFGPMMENFIGVLQGADAALVASGRLNAGETDAAVETLRTWSRAPDAALWYSLPLVEGRRP